MIEQPVQAAAASPALPAASGGSAAAPAQTQGADYSLLEYLRQQRAAETEAALANLRSAYEQSMLGYDAAAAQMAANYETARSSLAGLNAQEKRAFDERAAAMGLSSGTAAQANLARSGAYQGNAANSYLSQAADRSAIALQRAQLTAQYQNAIAQAQASGDASLANDLYNELVRLQNLARSDEQLQWNRNYQLGRDAVSDRRADAQLAMTLAQYQAELFGNRDAAAAYLGYTPTPVTAAYSADGQSYNIGSDTAQLFLLTAAPGATMTGGDGSRWVKNSDGSVTVTDAAGRQYVTLPQGTGEYTTLFQQLQSMGITDAWSAMDYMQRDETYAKWDYEDKMAYAQQYLRWLQAQQMDANALNRGSYLAALKGPLGSVQATGAAYVPEDNTQLATGSSQLSQTGQTGSSAGNASGTGGYRASNPTDLAYNRDEGVWRWDGRIYTNTDAMLNAIDSASGNMSGAQKAELTSKFQSYGFDVKIV